MCHSARKQLRIPRRHVSVFWDTQCKFQNVAGQARTWAIVAALQTKGNSIAMEKAASMIGMLHKATPSNVRAGIGQCPATAALGTRGPRTKKHSTKLPKRRSLGRN
ncbi:hypothetical protein FSOLCH5_003888 [Fusarium solani]